MKNWYLIAAAIICVNGSTIVSAGNECLTFEKEFHNVDKETNTKGGCLYHYSSGTSTSYPWFWKIDSSKGCESANIKRDKPYENKEFCTPRDDAGKK
ncbi:MAG: hypothetical protein K2X53_06280 [Alphaproteobacteria bacterium]|nr:hypothetical protein [Alphaproteobacteria bacterium]